MNYDSGVLGSLSLATTNNLCPSTGTHTARLEMTSTLSLASGIWMTTSYTNTVTDTAKVEWEW